MADEEPRPPIRFTSLEPDPDSSAGGTPDEPDLDPLQRVQVVWHLLRLLVAVSAIVGGLFMSSCGTFLAVAQLAETPYGPNSRSAAGVVVGLKRTGHGTRNSSYLYVPIVRVSGSEVEITGRLYTKDPPQVGERVQVRYDRTTPDHAVLVGWAVWREIVEWLSVGGGMLAVGIVFWRRRWWRRPEAWW